MVQAYRAMAGSTEFQYEDDSELEKTLDVSRLLASEMDSLVGEIQRQLSVNAAALTSTVNRANYGQAVAYVLYILTAIMGVRLVKIYVCIKSTSTILLVIHA